MRVFQRNPCWQFLSSGAVMSLPIAHSLKAVENISATTFDDFLYLGYANAWMYPENALVTLNKAEQENPNHNIVRLFRAQANRFYAMMLGDTQITEA